MQNEGKEIETIKESKKHIPYSPWFKIFLHVGALEGRQMTTFKKIGCCINDCWMKPDTEITEAN